MKIFRKPQSYYFTTARGCTITALLFSAGMALILIGGPALSRWSDRSYRSDIDRHGLIIEAVVYKKWSSKGDHIGFRYRYKGKAYTNSEMSSSYYATLTIGETIEVKIDTTGPDDSYIFATGIDK